MLYGAVDDLDVCFRARPELVHTVDINAINHTDADIRLYTEVRMKRLEEMGKLKKRTYERPHRTASK